MQDEPYWDDLVGAAHVVARAHVASTLLSCLSAHAALTIFDGIERVRLPTKCTGVFPPARRYRPPLTTGLEAEIVLPHSRLEHRAARGARARGLQRPRSLRGDGLGRGRARRSGSPASARPGHPEYDPSSLLREYRRDAGRYVHHERDDLPFSRITACRQRTGRCSNESHHEIIEGAREPLLIDRYPFDEVGARAPWPWRTRRTPYANWLTSVVDGEGVTHARRDHRHPRRLSRPMARARSRCPST